MPAKIIAVLVVEDEPLVRMDIVTELEDHGLQVLEAGNALEAIAILENQPVLDVIFTWTCLSGSTGWSWQRSSSSTIPRLK